MLVLTALGVALVACWGSVASGNARAAMPTPMPVNAEVAVIIAEGEVVPAQHVTLAFRVGGRVTRIPVHEGDRVKAGTLLARLDDALLQAQVAQAGAAVTLAEKQLARLKA